jgi:hypothetical protein
MFDITDFYYLLGMFVIYLVATYIFDKYWG